jgi:hypothetical protein
MNGLTPNNKRPRRKLFTAETRKRGEELGKGEKQNLIF